MANYENSCRVSGGWFHLFKVFLPVTEHVDQIANSFDVKDIVDTEGDQLVEVPFGVLRQVLHQSDKFQLGSF